MAGGIVGSKVGGGDVEVFVGNGVKVGLIVAVDVAVEVGNVSFGVAEFSSSVTCSATESTFTVQPMRQSAKMKPATILLHFNLMLSG